MHAPVLVAPPAELPVSIDEAKKHLRVAIYDADGNMLPGDDDDLIEGLIRAAVSHLDGWTGILGRALVEQTWRLDFDAFCRPMRLPLGPINEIESITWRNAAGQVATIAPSNYALRTDARGAYVHWDRSYSFPGDLYESAPISVTFTAGVAPADVPAAIKVAILLLVGTWFDNREATVFTSVSELPFAVSALLTPFRRMTV